MSNSIVTISHKCIFIDGYCVLKLIPCQNNHCLDDDFVEVFQGFSADRL